MRYAAPSSNQQTSQNQVQPQQPVRPVAASPAQLPQKPAQPAGVQQSVTAGQKSAPQATVSAPRPVSAPEHQKVIQSQVVSVQSPVTQNDPVEYDQPQPISQVKQESVLAEIQPQVSQTQPEEENPDYYVKPVDDRPKFDAICDMCGDNIQIPFQPDGKRPTFCKDCLKEYQRMTAKEKLNQQRKLERQQEELSASSTPAEQAPRQPQRTVRETLPAPQPAPAERKTEHKAFISKDRPMSLSQMQHIAPKKFKPRPRPNVNLDEVRNLINANKKEN